MRCRKPGNLHRANETLERRDCLSPIGFTSHVIVESDHETVSFVEAGDLDGDGAVDVLVGGSSGVTWHRNLSIDGQFGPAMSLTPFAAEQVYAVDLDGDQDLDVLANVAVGLNDYILWFENTDGMGTFSNGETLLRANNNAFNFGDLDGDGDIDLAMVLTLQDEIVWVEHTDGEGTFRLPHFIDRQRIGGTVYEHFFADYITRLTLGDVDGDGDLDLITATGPTATPSVWYRNDLDTTGQFVLESFSFDSGFHTFIVTSDVDGDGDLDLLSTDGDDVPANFIWRENDLLGTTGFSQLHEIAELLRPSFVISEDLDSDGDPDLVYVTEWVASQRKSELVWQENLGGGEFGDMVLLATPDQEMPATLKVVDLDSDGDLDIIAATTDQVFWFESDIERRLPGDANRDGTVTLDDYSILSNNFGRLTAGWSDGDFNGDGRVSFSDFLVLAHQFTA